MKNLRFLLATFLILFISVPVFADEAKDYIEGEVADWNRIVIDNGYNLLGSYIGSISGEDVFYTFDLGPGVYHLYASGGMNINDLDVYVYDMDGRELGSDTFPDKIPIVVINVRDRAEVSVQVQAFAFTEGYDTDSFCIVMAAEDGGQVYSVTSEAAELEQVEIAPSEELEEVEVEEVSGDQYMAEAEENIGYWEEYEGENGNEIIDSGVVLVEEGGFPLTIRLDPGFYVAYALPDSRCSNLDMQVYDENGNLLVEDTMEDNFPYCEFLLVDRQTVEFVMDVPNEGRDFETYASYIVTFTCGTDEDSRQAYVEKELEWAVNSSEEAGEEIFDRTVETISMRDPVVTFDVDLESGSYWAEAEGGIAINNLDMRVYDSEGNILSEDTYDDNFPMAWFDMSGSGTVTFEIELVDMEPGFDQEFYFWILTSTLTYDGMDHPSTEWSGDEGELINGAELESEMILQNSQLHGEKIIEEWTEPIDLDEDSIWTYEIDLEQGVYYVYAQGDGICLNDLDMYIYDEEGNVVTQDEAWYNSAVCRLDVGRHGGTYKIEVYAYWLDCEVGYFHMIIAKEQ